MLKLALASSLLACAAGAAPAHRPVAPATAPTATAPTMAPAAPAARLVIEVDTSVGRVFTPDEQRVFDQLPAVLGPAPAATPPYRNWTRHFHIEESTSNPREWQFSGVRLMTQALYVNNAPAIETFFEGRFDPVTGKAELLREVRLPSS